MLKINKKDIILVLAEDWKKTKHLHIPELIVRLNGSQGGQSTRVTRRLTLAHGIYTFEYNCAFKIALQNLSV